MHSQVDGIIFSVMQLLFAAGLVQANVVTAQVDHSVLAIWSQVNGSDLVHNNPADYAKPQVDLRYVLQGPAQNCNDFLVFQRSSAGAQWQFTTQNIALARPQQTKSYQLGATGFPVTLCVVPMQDTWYEVALSSCTVANKARCAQQYQPVNISHPSNSAVLIATAMGPASIGNRAVNNQVNNTNSIIMLTLGDTGCRGHDGSKRRFQQHCDPRGWVFPALMKQAAALTIEKGKKPIAVDIVLHVGDYRYYLEHTTGGSNDTFRYWQQDFFDPAQPMLKLAPWLLSRGNHESCDMFGHAWRYFFASTDQLTNDQSCDDLVTTRYVDVGPGQGADAKTRHRIVMIDSSAPNSSELIERFSDAIRATGAKHQEYVSSTHWMTHEPGLALLGYCNGQCFDNHVENGAVQRALQTALKASGWPICGVREGKKDSHCAPSTLLQGHQHFLERIRVVSPSNMDNPMPSTAWIWPQSYIIGNGGTKHDSVGTAAGRCISSVKLSGRNDYSGQNKDAKQLAVSSKAAVYSSKRHGFVLWQRNADIASNPILYPSGWNEIFYWADGLPSPADDGDDGCQF